MPPPLELELDELEEALELEELEALLDELLEELLIAELVETTLLEASMVEVVVFVSPEDETIDDSLSLLLEEAISLELFVTLQLAREMLSNRVRALKSFLFIFSYPKRRLYRLYFYK